MTNTIWRKSVISLISFTLIPLTLPHGNSCAWWEPDDIIDTSVFIPEMISDARFDAFFLSIWDYYNEKDNKTYPGRKTAESITVDDLNLLEWQNYWKGVDGGLMYKLVYELSEQSIDSVSNILRAGRAPGGEMASLGADKSKLAGMEYLKLAKLIQRAINGDGYTWNWDEDAAKKDKPQIDKLVEQARIRFTTAKDPFLKMRYGFQFVRSCYASGQYIRAVEFAKSEYAYQPEDGHMYYRTHGYEAAALCKLGRFSEANLWYARMYDAGEAYRLSAFESFHPQHETEWQQTLALAKNPRDKELLWHLLGVYADPIRGMNEIAAINPQSDLLPLLMVRAVNIAEHNTLSNSRYPGESDFSMNEVDTTQFTIDPYFSWYSVQDKQLQELDNCIAKIAALRKEDKGVWLMAQAFVTYLRGDQQLCLRQTENALEIGKDNPLIRAQAAIHQLIARWNELKQLRTQDEQEILNLIQGLNPSGLTATRSANAERMMLRFMRKQFLEYGNELRAELAEPSPDEFYRSTAKTQEMIDFMLRTNHTPFEKYVLARYPIKLIDLYDVLAVGELYAGNFEAARDIYAKNLEAGKNELLGNPFNIHIVDCHDCDHAKPMKTPYTKRKFVDKILEMKAKANDVKLEAKERATNYFLMANGLYNMTWYGNARLLSATVVNWDYSDSNRFAGYTNEKNENVQGYYNCEAASENYLKAFALSTDAEFKAKCIWMAAKCEHNRWLETQYSVENSDAFKSGEFFRRLRDEYSNTQYYKQVIAECGYYCQFITPGNQSCIRNK
ncbi:MAG: hypothetical protein ACK5B6_09015 [Bacteroidia bacterium]